MTWPEILFYLQASSKDKKNDDSQKVAEKMLMYANEHGRRKMRLEDLV